MPRNANCARCSLSDSAKHVCLYGDGNRSRRIMVVGEAPGEAEDRTGKPFQGKSGSLLRAELAKHFLEDVYITNVVKCRPPDNRKPEKSEVDACSRYLRDEFDRIRPTHVLLLGASAYKACLGRSGITEASGKIIEKEGITYVPSLHPAAILRDPSKKNLFSIAIKRFADAVSGVKLDIEDFQYQIVSKSTFDDFLADYERCNEFSFDLETTGLEWWKCQINCIGFHFDHGASWVLPVEKVPVLPRYEWINLIKHLIITQQHRRASGWNAKFDNLFLLAATGYRFRLDDDGILLHHALDEEAPHGLKENSRIYLGAPDYDLTTKEKKGDTTAAKLFKYCALDTFYTYRLVKLFRGMLQKDEAAFRLYERLTIRANRAMEAAEFERFYVDLERMRAVETEQRTALIEVERELNRLAGRTINWRSPDQVASILFGDLKLRVFEKTPKGKPSTSETALMYHDHEIVKVLQKYREHEKFLSTYIEGWYELMDGPKLAMSFKIFGTVTGRYSSRLHSIPRDGTIRNLCIAPPGWTFVAADYSQIELRIVAWLSKDPIMRMIFQTGGDIHRETAIYVSGILNPTKEDRKKAKAINFGFIYGMGAPKFRMYAKQQYDVEFTMPESFEYRERYFSRFERVPKWHDKQRAIVRADGQVRNLAGRVRHLPMVHSSDSDARAEAERQAINSPVQGFAGDLKAMALVELSETFPLYSFKLFGEHHDAVLMAVRNEYLDDHLPRIRRIMEHPALLDEFGIVPPVPIIVEIETGPWGKGEKWDEDRILDCEDVAPLPKEIRLQVQPEAPAKGTKAAAAQGHSDREVPRRKGPRLIRRVYDKGRKTRIRLKDSR